MSELLSQRPSTKVPTDLLRQVINSMTDSVFFKSLDGKYLGCNQEYEKLIGRTEAYITGRTAYDLNPVELADVFTASDRTVIDTRLPIKIEVWLEKTDRTMVLVENTKAPLFDNDGNIMGILGVLRDITRQKEAEDALKASEEKYRLITENTSDAIWIYNLAQDRFTYYSPSVRQLRGMTVEGASSEKILDTVTSEFRDMLSNRIADARDYLISHPESARREIIEVQQPTCAGGAIWIEISARLRFNEQKEIEVLGVSRNIDDRKRAESEIVYLGYHDQLTGLYNRYYFETIINQEMERSDRYDEPLSMLLFDLDYFKEVNDTWGHPVGDDLLKCTARVVEKVIRSADILVRLGGEEFAVLMPQTAKDGALDAAEKIRVAIENELHPVVGTRTASIGVAQRMNSESFRHWYRRSDIALYRAKEYGRNRVAVSDEDDNTAAGIMKMNWRRDWESGHSDIDRQHQELAEVANTLLDVFLTGGSREETERRVGLLLDSAVRHFEFEEDVMRAIGFPDYANHSELHAGLVSKAMRLNESFKRGEVKASAFFSFVMDDVILGHLVECDTKFFPYTRRTDDIPRRKNL